MNLNFSRLSMSAVTTVAALGLSACGGGGGSGGGSTSASAPSSATAPTQITLPGFLELPNLFLLFPNPQKQDDGTIQTNTAAYATAYYTAIDPANERTTKAAFLAKNGFGNSAIGNEKTVVFGDTKDLGYGRRMTARHNNDGTMAFVIDNYVVDLGGAYGYSTLNVDAAVVQLASRFFGTNAIEYSPSPTGGPNLVKFYNYAPDGTRNLVADLDGLGDKAMPHICTNCHGGRADPLTPAGLFPTVGNSISQKPGDVLGRLQALKVSTFDFSTLDASFTRSAQEANLKTINTWILESYPLPAPSIFPEDANRPVAGLNEWPGTAARLIKDAYGGDNLPNATYMPPPPPTAWVTAGQTSLYQSAVEPSCVTCHVLRGTVNQSDIDFATYTKFFGYSDRIKAHVFDRGNMPLAKIVFNDLWEPGSVMPSLFASFLESPSQVLAPAPYTVRSGGTILTPGRPIADPGPDRTVPQGATTLSATGSLYASSFAWSLVSENGGAVSNATLTNPSSASATFSATSNGTYTVRLVATNSGGTPSSPSLLTIVVDNALSPAPSTIRFSDIKTIFTSAGCNAACHVQPLTTAGKPPLSYSAADYVDDASFYAEVRGRINFTDIVASPLLRKPSGHHHNGGAISGFDDTVAPGNTLRSRYDLLLNWILSGAPRT